MFERTPIDVGWYIEEPAGTFVFPAPEPLFKSRSKALSNRAVQACPAVNELERDYFVLTAPFDIRLRCTKNKESYDLHVVTQGTRIDDDLIPKFVFLMQPQHWRDSSTPVIQLRLPYFFLSDEPCFMTMLAPYMSQSILKWPGIMVGGRLPIHIWPRILNWGFEWIDLDQDLRIRRGQPLCYVYFETGSLQNKVNLFELENTEKLQEFRKGISSTPKYMSNTFSLFETAMKRRPKKLLVKKK